MDCSVTDGYIWHISPPTKQKIQSKLKQEEYKEKVNNLLEWAKTNGGDVSRIRVSHIPGRGLGVVATCDIDMGEPILSISPAMQLTVSSASKSPQGQTLIQYSKQNQRPVSARCLIYATLIAAKFDRAHHWHEYATLLPQKHSDPLWWSDEDLKLLQGTQLAHDVPVHLTKLRSLYNEYFPIISQIHPSIFPPNLFTFQNFLWARSCLTSRCFHEDSLRQQCASLLKATVKDSTLLKTTVKDSTILKTTVKDSNILQDCPAVLFPVLDLTNHDTTAVVRVGMVTSTTNVGISCVSRNIKVDEEIPNNYGSRSNYILLLSFGFCMLDNSADNVPMRMGVRPGSLSNYKKKILDICNLDVTELHYISLDNLMPTRLLACVRLLLIDEPVLTAFHNDSFNSTSPMYVLFFF